MNVWGIGMVDDENLGLIQLYEYDDNTLLLHGFEHSRFLGRREELSVSSDEAEGLGGGDAYLFSPRDAISYHIPREFYACLYSPVYKIIFSFFEYIRYHFVHEIPLTCFCLVDPITAY